MIIDIKYNSRDEIKIMGEDEYDYVLVWEEVFVNYKEFFCPDLSHPTESKIEIFRGQFYC